MSKRSLFLKLLLVVFSNLFIVLPVLAEDNDNLLFILDDVVVSASKYSERLSETTVSVVVISEEEIVSKNSSNVAELLGGISSININDQGTITGTKTISIRGAQSEQVLVLFDGVPMNSSQNGIVDLGIFSTEQIERIEVIKGPVSALYGANALGGVVNIITKNGSEESEFIQNTAIASYNTVKYSLVYCGTTADLKYNLSINKLDSTGHRDYSELEQRNIFTKFNFMLDNYSDLIFSLQYNNSEKMIPGMDVTPTPNAKQVDDGINTNLQWIKKTDNSDSRLTLYYNQNEQNYYDRYYSNKNNVFDYNSYYYDDRGQIYYFNNGKKVIIDSIDLIENITDSIHNTKKIGLEYSKTDYYPLHTLTYGGEFFKDIIDSNENGNHDTINKAFFIQDDWKLNALLKITMGGRYDHHEVFGGEFSPRLGAVYSLNSKVNLHASVGKAYRIPSFNDLYWPADAYTEGNSDLEPERATAYETGIRYLDEGLKGEVNIFKRDAENLIEWAGGDDFIWRPYNINSAETLGGELLLTQDLTDSLSLDFNYSYLNARDMKTGKRLASIDHHNLNLGLSYTTEELSGSIDGRLVTGRANELPAYFVLDTILSKEFEGNIRISLGVNNLLDREYEVIRGYSMPGRNYMLEFSSKF